MQSSFYDLDNRYVQLSKQGGPLERLSALIDWKMFRLSLKIIEAIFVPVPIQRNSRSDNETIKAGNTPSDWTGKKTAHKNVDVCWTKKNNQNHYGYKDHINVDAHTKLITQSVDTDTSVHGSQAIEAVMRPSSQAGASYTLIALTAASRQNHYWWINNSLATSTSVPTRGSH